MINFTKNLKPHFENALNSSSTELLKPQLIYSPEAIKSALKIIKLSKIVMEQDDASYSEFRVNK